MVMSALHIHVISNAAKRREESAENAGVFIFNENKKISPLKKESLSTQCVNYL